MRSTKVSAGQMSFPDFTGQPCLAKVNRERLPTNATANRHAVHRWFNFIAGFSPEFVQNCCDGIRDDEKYLLDPFAGCGTALVGALEHGLTAVGYESHPVFSRIARAKLPNPSWHRVNDIERVILTGLLYPVNLGTLPEAPRAFLGKLFDRTVIERLLGARDALIAQGLAEDDLAFLILSRMLDLSSRSQTDGIYKAPTSAKVAQSPEQSCRETVKLIESDVDSWTSPSQRGLLFSHSSESMPELEDDSIDLIVTSPPYLNNFDFAEMTRMHLYFWGIASSWGEITSKVRSKLLVNTTTALAGHKDKQVLYREQIPLTLLSRLDNLVSELRGKRAEKAGKKEYDFLVYPYFAQMSAVLRECFRVSKHNAEIHIMVADAALYGIHISTPQFLTEIMEDIGFGSITCSIVRQRGHRWVLDKRDGSPLGLGEYHIQARK
jgi:DNA modification methylase